VRDASGETWVAPARRDANLVGESLISVVDLLAGDIPEVGIPQKRSTTDTARPRCLKAATSDPL